MDASVDAGPSGYRAPRLLIQSNLADPDVLKESDQLYLLSGTSPSPGFTIYESSDLQSFTVKTTYNPSQFPGAQHDYCYLWAPEMWRGSDGRYYLYFSAHQVGNGQPCPPSDQTVTTFFAVADDASLEFGPPVAIQNPVGQPRSTTAQGCPGDGCINAIRIDTALWGEPDPWLFYIWFEGGNHIASFPLSNPSQVVQNCDPVHSWEESINEAPDIFERDGRLYLFFSAGHFRSEYAMYYIMANSVEELTRARNVRRYSRPIRLMNGEIVENAGHSAVTHRNGEYYIFYHVGELSGGAIRGRHTYRKPLFFHPDGSVMSLDSIRFRWPRLDGYEYSLDLKPMGESWVGPCVSVAHLGTDLSYRYHGKCANSDTVIRKAALEAVRLFYSPVGSGVWNQFAEVAYDGYRDDVDIPLPGAEPGLVTVRWNELQTGAEYSLDVKPIGGDWLAPCVGADELGSGLEHDYTGICLSGSAAGTEVPPIQVERFRVCSAMNGNWAAATCRAVDYGGSELVVWILLPEP